MSYPSLSQRKRERVAAMRQAVADLVGELAAYAEAHGGRFVLFGSAARDELRPDSDVDILVDFPLEAEQAAWLFAEARAHALGLAPDIQIKAWSGPRLLARIAAEGRPLP